jgi:hypothetical protein
VPARVAVRIARKSDSNTSQVGGGNDGWSARRRRRALLGELILHKCPFPAFTSAGRVSYTESDHV